MIAKYKLTTTTDIEFVVGASIREQVKVRNHNLPTVIYPSPATLWMMGQMEAKLQLPRIRDKEDSFRQCTPNELVKLLEDEVKELKRAINKGGNIIEECADVANFAMFIAINDAIKQGLAE